MSKIKIIATLSCILIGVATTVFSSTNWNYDNNSENGPARWSEFHENCKSGGFQSPIDIRQANITGKAQSPVNLYFKTLNVRFSDDGHSIIPESMDRLITIGKTSYSLVQIHFHSSAETLLNGKRYAMEAHFVMKDNRGKFLVLAVLIQPGKANTAFERLSKEEKSAKIALSEKDVSSLFPNNLKYYTFEGSLTTPGCDRGIAWIVFENPIMASQGQIQSFQREHGDNYRPVQAVNGRPILVGTATENR